MKKALISPTEIVRDGARVAEVRDQEFEVAEPLFWVECEDSCSPYYDYWNGTSIVPNPDNPRPSNT